MERYAARWAIEVAFHDAKNTTGVGEAGNRTRNAIAAQYQPEVPDLPTGEGIRTVQTTWAAQAVA
ncbi:hypothetical protein [Dactylosporangium sp. CA-233914]|uniref:hypothetical protein n=1 Tax=Dactylosporangium sp. CA-233914 TaxID=3239934 RepID=UPI003D90322F